MSQERHKRSPDTTPDELLLQLLNQVARGDMDGDRQKLIEQIVTHPDFRLYTPYLQPNPKVKIEQVCKAKLAQEVIDLYEQNGTGLSLFYLLFLALSHELPPSKGPGRYSLRPANLDFRHFHS